MNTEIINTAKALKEKDLSSWEVSQANLLQFQYHAASWDDLVLELEQGKSLHEIQAAAEAAQEWDLENRAAECLESLKLRVA